MGVGEQVWSCPLGSGHGHLQTQMSLLKEVLPELGKVREGGKVSRENGRCKDRHELAWLSVQTLGSLEWLETTGGASWKQSQRP